MTGFLENLANLEMSGILSAVRKMSVNWPKVWGVLQSDHHQRKCFSVKSLSVHNGLLVTLADITETWPGFQWGIEVLLPHQ